MKLFGYLVIALGFLVGAYAAVQQPEGVNTLLYVVGAGLGVAGVALVRVADRLVATDVERMAAGVETVGASLETVVREVERLDREKDDIGVYDLRHRIDDVFPAPLAAFVDARESLAHRYGLQPYADLMSHFATGERSLNRVWSASTDGYIDEAYAYIGRAREEFEIALERFRALEGERGRMTRAGGPAAGRPTAEPGAGGRAADEDGDLLKGGGTEEGPALET